MIDKPDNPFQFWQELKRRKVFRVIAMYAATAFIIMEAGEIMLPRLGLPDWTVTFIIVLIIIGFPIAIILSWIFDITPEGVKKTESIEVAKEHESPSGPVKRRLRVSDVIIAILVLIVMMLAYPKIFKKDRFEDIRDADGKISIVVMPFQNITGDTLYAGMELGMQNLMITRLSNSDEISVRQIQTMGEILSSTKNLNYASITPSIASDIALKLDANTVILGSIHKSGKNLRITANFLDSRSKEIYKSFEIDGDSENDFFTLSDSLTTLIKNHLEIKVLEQDMNEETRLWAKTESAEAYLHFSKGLNKFWSGDMVAASHFLETALEIDPSFFSAAMILMPAYANRGMHLQLRQLIELFYIDIDDHPYADQLIIKYWKSRFDKKQMEGINYLKIVMEENPLQRGIWYQLGRDYHIIEQYRNAIEAFEKALEIDRKWGGGWEWVSIYTNLGLAYHETEQHAREKEIYELGLDVLPDHPGIIFRQAICVLSLGDTIKANEYIAKYISIRKERSGWTEASIKSSLGNMYSDANILDEAELYYRQALDLTPQSSDRKNALASLLIENDINIKEGLELVNHALELHPDNINYQHTKAWGLYKYGKYEEALDLLEKSWEERTFYNHDHYLLLQLVEQTLANQNN